MTTALTHDQLTLLRLARGDRLPPSPYERPQTRLQDRNLLLALRLIERRDASFVLTPAGAEYLERAEAELQVERWEDLRGTGGGRRAEG